VACESAPFARHATRIRTISSSPSRLPPSCPFRGFSPPLSNSRRAPGHDAAIVLNTVCESASYTVVPPHPHPRRQTDTSHPAAVAPQTTWVSFFSPSLTGAGQRWPRHHGPPSCSRHLAELGPT